MIDYVFRYDPAQSGVERQPATAEEARAALIEGNRVFSQWMESCRTGQVRGGSQYVVSASGLESAFRGTGENYPTQKPFAVVVGCSDARVPTELLFGQGFNDLFVVRVAGNVLEGSAQGSVDFSVVALNESLRVMVVLGHTNCGAVKGAVDAYLTPSRFWSRTNSPFLRSILQEIFVAVRESDNAIRQVWGPDAPSQPGYRETLIDVAVCVNAAHSAFALRQQVEAAAQWDIEVLYGVFDIRTLQVCMPIRPGEPPSPENVNLASAPGHPREFAALALDLAARLRGSAGSAAVANPIPPDVPEA